MLAISSGGSSCRYDDGDADSAAEGDNGDDGVDSVGRAWLRGLGLGWEDGADGGSGAGGRK
jgi:hypothetical protein